ncbi:S-layer homology domain-containing protein [Paenibacillus monticola]|uniref:S-layer homology domain-containing protein n=1 Tax=Paenibacillus monticola TaxID=2666075 RepID=A0A7X2HC76_9BACL|nr:S-layer homology domain-containing protein [Paenibacillus monticola]MRN57375.1 S-layer homology domain-containing protein [Paenibacillus monticola]
MYEIKQKVRKTVTMLLGVTLFIGSTSIPQAKADSSQFNDVPANHWARPGIETAVHKGYINGYPGGLFKPSANISRAEFIKMIVTATGQSVEAGSGSWYESYVTAAQNEKIYINSDFTNSSTEWNKEITRKEMARIAARAAGLTTEDNDKWMYLATKKGLVNGLGGGQLGLDEKTTRAQSVAVIERVLTVRGGGTLPTDKYTISSAELAWHGTNIFTIMPEVFIDKKVKDNVEDLWKKDKMIVNSKDGKYRGELEALIAIDLADPNDPNLSEIPPISKLKWNNEPSSNSAVGIPISKWRDSYLLYFKSNVVNEDTEHYASFHNFVSFGVIGIYNDDIQAFGNGKLNRIGSVFKDKPLDQPIIILPKTGWMHESTITFMISTPAFSSYYMVRNKLISFSGPLSK